MWWFELGGGMDGRLLLRMRSRWIGVIGVIGVLGVGIERYWSELERRGLGSEDCEKEVYCFDTGDGLDIIGCRRSMIDWN